MPIVTTSEDALKIRQVIPLNQLSTKTFYDLCAALNIEESCNSLLFAEGDDDSHLIYLMEGTVILQGGDLIIEKIEAGSEAAKFALAHQIPRKIDAFAQGTVRIARVPKDFLTLTADSVSKNSNASTETNIENQKALFQIDDGIEVLNGSGGNTFEKADNTERQARFIAYDPNLPDNNELLSQIKILKSENAQLRSKNQQLWRQSAQLENEKQKLAQQCLLLTEELQNLKPAK